MNIKLPRSLILDPTERFVWMLYLVIVLLFFVAATLLLIERYQSRISLTYDYLDNLTEVNEANLLLQMRNIETILRVTADEIENSIIDEEVLNEYIASIARGLPQLRTMLVISNEGIVIADSRPDMPALGLSTSDRTYFRVHADGVSGFLFIDDPVQSRIDGFWSLPLTIDIRDENDQFLGIVAASLDPIYFSESIGNFAEQAIIGYIAKDNGVILTSMPYDATQIGDDLSMHLLGIPSDDPAIHDDNIIIPDVDFIVHRHIEAYGLQIIFSRPQSVIVRSFIYEAILIFGVLIFLSVSTFMILYQQIKQMRRIQRSENELRTLTDNIGDVVVRFNRDLQPLYVNPALLRSTGLTIEQYIDKINTRMVDDDHANFWDQAITRVFDTRENQVFEFHYGTQDGDTWFQVKLTPEFDGDHDVGAVLAVIRDITDLKHAQFQLEEKTKTLSLSLKAAMAGVWVWDLNTNDIVWDEAMERLHGLSPGTFGGDYEAWRRGVHPDDLQDVEAEVMRCAENRIPFEKQFRVILSDGSVRYLLSQAMPVYDADIDKPLRMIGVNIDITERLEAEERRLQTERERIEMIEQRKIIELKGRFITTASHEFRTPLAIIRSSTDMLENYHEKYSSEERLEKLRRINEQVQHMIRLLDDVLTISKSNDDKLTLSLSQINLYDFCHQIWDNVLIVDNGRHIKDYSYLAEREQFVADHKLLRQVLDNLLNNALKYTPDGKQVLFEVSDDDGWITFKVIDQGYGIPEKDIDQIFEPFHRANNVSTIEGTGLGLTIVAQFVELHQGTINVSSKEDEGTQFVVKIPTSIEP